MKTYLKTLFVILLLATNYCSEAQKMNKSSLQNAVTEIANLNIYETTFTVGYANIPSSQYQRFNILISLATDKELIMLAEEHKNPVVRLYSFQALKKRKIEIPSSLIEKFKIDENEVISLQGCLAENTRVNQLSSEIFIPSSNYEFIKEY